MHAPNANGPSHAALALLALSAASGCAALIYQVVWFQLLGLSIGTSALSLAVLPAVFLGGMCIGSLLTLRFAALQRRPLRTYALLELAIGGLGALALYAIPAIGQWYVAWAGNGVAGLLLRVAAAAFALLPSTVLMGATLPVIASWTRMLPRGVEWLGAFYACNIGGAVIGTLLAGFYLLRVHDAQIATWVAVALNATVAATSWRIARNRDVRVAAERVPSAQRATTLWPLYIATALSGMTALCAQVLWTRHLSLLFGATVYAFALILAVFLFGLGAGGAAGAGFGRRIDPRGALCACQLLTCAAMTWAAYAIARWLPYWPLDVTVPSTAALALPLDLLRTAVAVLPAALLWGASFPLALAAADDAGAQPRRAAAALYAANTAGAIVGALGTGFVLVIWIGSQAAQQTAIAIAALSGLLLYHSSVTRRARLTRLATGAAVLASVALLAIFVPRLPPELVAYGRFLPTRGLGANVVYVGEGLTASIAVTREPDGTLTYHNAGKTQASTYRQDLRLQRMLGHLATLVPESPASVLVIGLGAGVTAGAVSIDPAVQRVVVAEIEPLVAQVAARYFGAPNFGVVANPKVELYGDDGRHYLATTREKFDAITSDPLDPWVKGAATLYTREFWELCKARLNDGGAVTVFLQLYESSDDAVKSEIATFFAAFPNGAVLANTVDGAGYDAVLLGRADDAPIDLERIARRLESGAYAHVARSLRDVGFDSTLDLVGTYVGQAQDLASWLDGAAINTDRNLRLQYLAGAGLNAQRADAILAAMSAHEPRFPNELFTGSPARLEELRQRLAVRSHSQ